MAMSAAPADDETMSDINVVPLTDVMLVLLIIFLITVPVVIQTVPVKLPTVYFEPTQTKPENVVLSVKVDPSGACRVYWGLTPVNSAELVQRAVAKLRKEIDKQGGPSAPGLELPEVHIRGDANTPYRCIGGTVFNMQRAGFVRVGFISEPPPGMVVRQ
jgi:biopolymer transport protein ExbD